MGTPHSIEDLTVLAARLQKGRRLRQLTRGELAVEAGVDIEVVDRMETGHVVSDEDREAVLAVVGAPATAAALHIPQQRTEAQSLRD